MLHTLRCPLCSLEFSIATEHVGYSFQCPTCHCRFSTCVLPGGYISTVCDKEDDISNETETDMDRCNFFENSSDDKKEIVFKEENGSSTDAASQINYILNTTENSPMLHKEDVNGLCEILQMNSDELLKYRGHAGNLSHLTIVDLKKAIHYLRQKYRISSGLELSGNKFLLVRRIFHFTRSETYQNLSMEHRLRHLPNVVTSLQSSSLSTAATSKEPTSLSATSLSAASLPSSTTSLPSSTTSLPSSSSSSALLSIFCPGCRTEHQVETEFIASDPSTHFSCPKCHAYFSVSLPSSHCTTTTTTTTNFIKKVDIPILGGMQDGNLVAKKYSQILKYPIQSWEIAPVRKLGAMGFSEEISLYSYRQSHGNIANAMICAATLSGDCSQSSKQTELSYLLDLDTMDSHQHQQQHQQQHQRYHEDVQNGSSVVEDGILNSPMYANSLLLDIHQGCLPFRHLVKALEFPVVDATEARGVLSSLVVKLLRLEQQILLNYVDCGRFYMKKVARELEKGIDKKRGKKLGSENLLITIPAPLLEEQVENLDSILHQEQRDGVANALLDGYITGKINV